MPFRPDWKLGCWSSIGDFAEEAKRISEAEYNISKPNDFLGARIGDYEEDDWVLIFSDKKPSDVYWLYVNYVVKVHKNEKVYERKYPRQIVQVWPLRKYTPPPFRADKKFGQAFSKAISDFNDSEIETLDAGKPPKRLLNLIEKYYEY